MEIILGGAKKELIRNKHGKLTGVIREIAG